MVNPSGLWAIKQSTRELFYLRTSWRLNGQESHFLSFNLLSEHKDNIWGNHKSFLKLHCHEGFMFTVWFVSHPWALYCLYSRNQMFLGIESLSMVRHETIVASYYFNILFLNIELPLKTGFPPSNNFGWRWQNYTSNPSWTTFRPISCHLKRAHFSC